MTPTPEDLIEELLDEFRRMRRHEAVRKLAEERIAAAIFRPRLFIEIVDAS